MRTIAKGCMVCAVILIGISTLFQGAALLSALLSDTPNRVFTEKDWLIPMWMVALVLVPAAAVLTKILKEKNMALVIPLVVAAAGTLLSLIVALTLKEALPPTITAWGESGLTTWKLIYRHLTSVFAGVLIMASATAHLFACREERIRRENEEYKSVYDLSGTPLFRDESDSTLGLEPTEEIATKPARKLKRSLRHKRDKA